MTPLAHEIYRQLLRHLRTRKASITYGELAIAVSKKIATHHRGPAFHAALTEVTTACRAAGLACLPAIVWRASGQRPGSGYYLAAHPRAKSDASRLAAWEHEHAEVLRSAATYPPTLGAP